MKLLIDSNVIIDVLNNREPFYNTSSVIWNYCETNEKINGYISTLTFANVVYIVRKKIEKLLGCPIYNLSLCTYSKKKI